MKFYFAPLEGVTGFTYRNAHQDLFGNDVDKYFTPFIVTNTKGKLSSKERKDIDPENNKNKFVVPQILTNNAEEFIKMSQTLKEFGYDEVNLNLGCPSGTVVSKKRGSGFLTETKELDEFLEQIFEADITKISIKTRIGKENPEEFYKLMEIYNKYPMEELIIHPRVQKDYYNNTPNMEIFKYAVETSKNKLCYNGDIFTDKQFKDFIEAFPSIDRIMLGRGLIANPGLIRDINEGITLEKKQLKEFHDRVYGDYKEVLYGDIPVLFKMKELWFYMSQMFTNYEKYVKKIRKSQKLRDYDVAVEKLFEEQDILPGTGLFSSK